MSLLQTTGRAILRDAVTLITAIAGTLHGTIRHSIPGTIPGMIRGTMAVMDGDGTAIIAGTVGRTTMVEAMLTAHIAILVRSVTDASAVLGHVVSTMGVTTAIAAAPSVADDWLTAEPLAAAHAPMLVRGQTAATEHAPMGPLTAVSIAIRTAISVVAAQTVAAILPRAPAATAVVHTLPHAPAATAAVGRLAAVVPAVVADVLAAASAAADDKLLGNTQLLVTKKESKCC